MEKLKKETMEKLDEINCATVLKQISIGNLVRGLGYLMGMLGEIKSCMLATSEQIRFRMAQENEKNKEKEKQETTAPAKPKKKRKKR